MKPNKKLIIIAASVLGGVAIAGGAAGATYAYFSATAATKVHVAAGSLKLKFERFGIAGELPSSGELVHKDADEELDYLDLTNSAETAYDVETAMPGLDVTVSFRVTNTATTAFSYNVKFLNLELGEGDLTDASNALSKSLSITITPEGATQGTSFFAKEMPKSFEVSDKVEVGASHTFTVRMVIDSEVGNDIQLGSLKYDLQVNAIQYHA